MKDNDPLRFLKPRNAKALEQLKQQTSPTWKQPEHEIFFNLADQQSVSQIQQNETKSSEPNSYNSEKYRSRRSEEYLRSFLCSQPTRSTSPHQPRTNRLMANNRGQPSSQHQAKIDENEIFGANKQVTATFSLEQNVTQDLQQCEICRRKFNKQSLIKHSAVCENVFLRKRNKFSSEKQRSRSKEQRN